MCLEVSIARVSKGQNTQKNSAKKHNVGVGSPKKHISKERSDAFSIYLTTQENEQTP